MSALFESTLTSVPLLHRGKVRDSYALGADHLLIVATDRISAFDVILPQPIPGKGAILTALSNFWMQHLAHILSNHLAPDVDLSRFLTTRELEEVRGRSVVAKKLKPLPIEAVARGYLIGSGWKEYQATGSVCGMALPKGLVLAGKLAEPIFTPASKAPTGQHDENISFGDVERLIGRPRAAEMRAATLRIYEEAASYALTRGIIIADTKFEFGLDVAGRLTLMDEALTPDSSRFWAVETYRAGMSPPSFDKQFVRDYLETLDWNKKAPAPMLPAEIIEKTAAKYREAQRLLMGD